ncbi:MAG: hypothetical protein HYX92_03015 [Chloroflexi bacterium]|nr:hypothetical protein [Chloroflexota bacterium]
MMKWFKVGGVALIAMAVIGLLAGTVLAADRAPAPPSTTGVEEHGMGGIGHGFLSDAVLQLLGMTRDQVLTELKAGKSLAQIAQAKGISEQKLIDTIVADFKAQLNKLVTEGKITAAQRDARLQNIEARVKAMVERTGFGRAGGMHGAWGGFGFLSDAVTRLLGMTREQVLTELKAGKSLAQIAQAKGVSEQKLIDTIVADFKAQLAKLVAEGRITQAQADARLQGIADRVKAMVERTGFGRAGGMHGAWGGFGFLSDAVTQLLGMTRDQILTELKAGKSLAQIAQAKGVSEQKLIDTIVADFKAQLAKLVAEGRITQAQADARLQGIAERVKAMVERTGFGRAGRGLGMRGQWDGGVGAMPGPGMMGRGRGNWNSPGAGTQGFAPGPGMMGRGRGDWNSPGAGSQGFAPGQGMMGLGGRTIW